MIAKFKMLSFCQKIIFLVSKIFMQIFNVSTLCMQSPGCKVSDGNSKSSGTGCSKLTTSLVNVSLNFQT